jgi:hypothetical protein
MSDAGRYVFDRNDQPTSFALTQCLRVLGPSLQGEPLRYLAHYEKVFLADSLRQCGLRHEYKIIGKGTPLIVYSKNPEITPKEKHYPQNITRQRHCYWGRSYT